MLYIHSTKDLNSKTAEIESIEIAREIRREKLFPASFDELKEYVSEFFVSWSDKAKIGNAISLIEPTINSVREVMNKQSRLYEPINIERTMNILKKLPALLKGSIEYIEDVELFKDLLTNEIVSIVNNFSRMNVEEKRASNQKLKEIFFKFLRNYEMVFNGDGIIKEDSVEHVNSLNKSMENGYFFHVTLEEEIRKDKFEVIKRRLPVEDTNLVDPIAANIAEIKKGVDAASQHNVRMINVAMIYYSLLKVAMKG